MAGPYTATHVPFPFDVVIDGWGYRFPDSVESHPFGTHRARYGLTPQFIPRTNVQGDYGDNFQDFWITLTQRDWSLGEGQRHFKSNDDESARRYYEGQKVRISVPGEVTLHQELRSVTPASSPSATGSGGGSLTSGNIYFATSTNLYSVNPVTGTITDHGAHGATIAADMDRILGEPGNSNGEYYFSRGPGIRKWDSTSFSNFTTSTDLTNVRDLVHLNNTMYALALTASSVMTLYRLDTAGVHTELHSWKTSDGGVRSSFAHDGHLLGFGGDLFILFGLMSNGPELWVYDGTGVSLVTSFPRDMIVSSMTMSLGVLFFLGFFCEPDTSGSDFRYRSVVWYYANGQFGEVWRSRSLASSGSPVPSSHVLGRMVPFQGGVAWTDDTESTRRLMHFDIGSGAVSSLANLPNAFMARMAVASSAAIWLNFGTTARLFPDGTNLAASGHVISSLFDGDNSLTKHFHAIRIDGEKNGGTFDLAYQIDSLAGAYTTLQTNATPGVEYELPNDATAQGRSISVKVTLNRASATAGPTLRRVQCRAAPVIDQYRRREYIVELTGVDGEGHMQLRDGSTSGKDGHAMAQDLLTAAALTLPLTVHDRFGTFEGILEADQLEIVEVRPEEYLARVPIRET